MARRWLHSVDVEVDGSGHPIVALSAPIEADLIDADLYEVTGTPPDNRTLYDVAVLGLGVGYPAGGSYLYNGSASLAEIAEAVRWELEYQGGNQLSNIDYNTADTAGLCMNIDMSTYDASMALQDLAYGAFGPNGLWSGYAAMSVADILDLMAGAPYRGPSGQSGQHAAGQDDYTTLITCSRDYNHLWAYCETNDAVLSVDGGDDNFILKAGLPLALDNVFVAGSVRAKNKTAGQNYANLVVNVW